MASILDRNLIGASIICNGYSNGSNLPPSPANNDQYIVGVNPVNQFTGAKKNQVARFNSFTNKWQFFDPETYTNILFDTVNKSIYKYNPTNKEWANVAYVGEDDSSHFGSDNKLTYPYPITVVTTITNNYYIFNPLENGIRNVTGYQITCDNTYNLNRYNNQIKILDISTYKMYIIGNDGTVTNIELYDVPDYKNVSNVTIIDNVFAPIYILNRINKTMCKIVYKDGKRTITSENIDHTIPRFNDYDYFIEYDSITCPNPNIVTRSSITSCEQYDKQYSSNIDGYTYSNKNITSNINPVPISNKLSNFTTKGLMRKDAICSNIMISTKKDQAHTDMCIPLSLRTIRAQFTQDQINSKKIVIKFDKNTNPWYNPIGFGYGINSPMIRFSVGGVVMSDGKDYKFTYEIGQHLINNDINYTVNDTIGIIDWNNMDLEQISLKGTDWYTITFNSMSSIGIAISNE